MANYLKYKKKLELKELVFYVSQLIIILENFHSRGYVYGNLIMDNIYIKENGYLILEGLEKSIIKLENDTLLYEISGKPAYIPPEAIVCEGYNFSSDLWKLGICAYQMYEGTFPFTNNNIKNLYFEILTKNISNNH
jgi:serine/threonine protein kinase